MRKIKRTRRLQAYRWGTHILASTNLYYVLNAPETASQAQLDEAVRKRRIQFHPDRNLDRQKKAHELFVACERAYAVLSDPGRRRIHDAQLQTQREQVARALEAMLQRKHAKFPSERTPLGVGLETQQQLVADVIVKIFLAVLGYRP